MRRHSRRSVNWLMLYGNEEFVANGSVLNVDSTAIGWRAEGPMPVHPGMRLNLWVWPPDEPKGVHVEDATVLWVKGYEFGLKIQDLNPADHEWLTQFLDRGVALWLVPQAA
jgi:hypothetical protein